MYHLALHGTGSVATLPSARKAITGSPTFGDVHRAGRPQAQTLYSVILSVLDPRKCEYLKDYSLDFEHAYMTT